MSCFICSCNDIVIGIVHSKNDITELCKLHHVCIRDNAYIEATQAMYFDIRFYLQSSVCSTHPKCLEIINNLPPMEIKDESSVSI